MALPALLMKTAGQRIVLVLPYKEDVGGSSPSTPTELLNMPECVVVSNLPNDWDGLCFVNQKA